MADAEAAVSAVKFHPLGSRGLARGTRPAGYGFGMEMADYVKELNQETLVCVQLEETRALDNLYEIVEVEGVDVLFIGPSDLSQSMGYAEQRDAPQVQRAMDQAFERIVAYGGTAGSAGGARSIGRYVSSGVLYAYVHLTTLLGEDSRRFRSEVLVEG